jgi:hypothetical protein
LATEVNGIPRSIQIRSKSATVELLLRCVVHSLANPCGFQLEHSAAPISSAVTADAERQNAANHIDTLAQHTLVLAPLRDVREDIPLALSLLFEGVFQSEIPLVDGRGGEGEKECADGPENDIGAAAPTGGQLDNTDTDTQQLFPRRNVIDKM